MNLHSIFYSIQGEGFHTGMPAVFVRFAGCNLACSWCDTDHSQQFSMSPHEIVAECKRYPSSNVILTGGEPMIQKIVPLVRLLHQFGFWVAIETNGTRPVPGCLDWITVSPKSPGRFKCNELKLVYTGQDISQYEEVPRFCCSVYRFLQPCSMENVDETVQMVKENPTWRLSLQTHKLIGIE